jgi:hypothetical protein
VPASLLSLAQSEVFLRPLSDPSKHPSNAENDIFFWFRVGQHAIGEKKTQLSEANHILFRSFRTFIVNVGMQ